VRRHAQRLSCFFRSARGIGRHQHHQLATARCQSVIARQHDGAAVELGQKVNVNVALCLAARLIANAALGKLLGRKLSAKSVANNLADTIAAQHAAKLGNDRLRRKRLRTLVKLIEYKKRLLVYSDFEDRANAETDIVVLGIPGGTDMDAFRRKARVFLKQHENHIAVLKVKRNEPIDRDRPEGARTYFS
jgi:hypothetical protein